MKVPIRFGSRILFASLVASTFLSIPQLAEAASTESPSESAEVNFVLRFGQGGFRDSRSPVNMLGGDQFAIDIKSSDSPIAISFTSEFYTNSANATHPYEISGLWAVNVLFTGPLKALKNTDYFFGGGVGVLEVPSSEKHPKIRETGNLFNLEAGLHYKAFRRFGFYAAGKYLYARKRVIDFNEAILLAGITYRFSL